MSLCFLSIPRLLISFHGLHVLNTYMYILVVWMWYVTLITLMLYRYWISNSAFSAAMGFTFKQTAIKKLFGIPLPPPAVKAYTEQKKMSAQAKLNMSPLERTSNPPLKDLPETCTTTMITLFFLLFCCEMSQVPEWSWRNKGWFMTRKPR